MKSRPTTSMAGHGVSRRSALRSAVAMLVAGGADAAFPSVAQASRHNRGAARPFLEYFPEPYDLLGARLACTVINEGRRGAFQRLVDESLNAATRPGRFKLSPLFSGVGIMGIFHFDAVRSRQTGAWGVMRYYEASLSLLVMDTAAPSSLRGVPHIFNPVMLLNDPYALIAGREIYGFPKMLGQFQAKGFPEDGAAASHPLRRTEAEVSVHGFSTRSPDEVADWHRLLDATVRPWGEVFQNDQRHDGTLFLQGITPEMPASTWNMIKALLSGNLQGIFLKRFPGCHAGAPASYCSVVRAPYQMARLKQIRTGSGCVTLHNPASFPLAEALGYTPDPSGRPVKVRGFGFLADTDWVLGAGTEV